MSILPGEDLAKVQLGCPVPGVKAASTSCLLTQASKEGCVQPSPLTHPVGNLPPSASILQGAGTVATTPLNLSAFLSTEHDRIKRQVQHWFRLRNIAGVDLALGPNTQVLAIAGDAVLKLQIVNRLFKISSYTSSAKALHDESLKYITNKQLACVIAWKLDMHKLLRLYNFTPRDPSKAAFKKLGTAVEALLGVLALQQPEDVESVIGQVFYLIGRDAATCEGSPAVSKLLQLQK